MPGREAEGLQQRVGQRVRELREARGLSQEALAFEASLDRTYVSSVERGRRNVSLSTLTQQTSSSTEATPREQVRA